MACLALLLVAGLVAAPFLLAAMYRARLTHADPAALLARCKAEVMANPSYCYWADQRDWPAVAPDGLGGWDQEAT